MTGSERNFRSHYYEKVGFRGVEEKKSLDILLSERPVDLARVQNFCLRIPLPSIYRSQVWQLILGVLPRYSTVTEWVWAQRVAQYREIERALTITRKVSQSTEPAVKATLIWLLETKQLKFDVGNQLEEPAVRNFTSIVSALAKLVNEPEEVYWIGKGLNSFLLTLVASKETLRPLTDCLTKLLKVDSVLLDHLTSSGILASLHYPSLWGRGLADIFLPTLLARLWDKVVGGSVKVLVYVLASTLIKCRLDILAAESCEQVLGIVTSMKEERQEVVLTQALDLWELDGCPLLPGVNHLAPVLGQEEEQHDTKRNSRKLEGRLSLEINVD